jgi:Zn-dependent protease
MLNFFFLAAIIPSIVLHEVSHGYVAYLCGDPTAKNARRLTLNPLRHIDPFGTILLPLILVFLGLPAFGYAKPVPVNVNRLRHPRNQSVYVSLVGPAVNIALSFVGYWICEFAIHVNQQLWTFNLGEALGLVNLALAAFNLLPIPPLDGSAVVERLVPQRHLTNYYRLRNRALPFVFIAVIGYQMLARNAANPIFYLENWWLGRLF